MFGVLRGGGMGWLTVVSRVMVLFLLIFFFCLFCYCFTRIAMSPIVFVFTAMHFGVGVLWAGTWSPLVAAPPWLVAASLPWAAQSIDFFQLPHG